MASIDEQESICVLLVASYSDVAHAVEAMATEVQRRISTSPTLGDFMTVRYTDLGSLKSDVNDTSAAEALLREMAKTGDSASYYLAAAVVDDSAARVETVLGRLLEMADALGLAVRVHGFAVGRPDVPLDNERVPITSGIAPSQLTDHIRRYADTLTQSIAASGDLGIPSSELTRVYVSLQPRTLGEFAVATPAPAQDDDSAANRQTVDSDDVRRGWWRRVGRPASQPNVTQVVPSRPSGEGRPSTSLQAPAPTGEPPRSDFAPVLGFIWASSQRGQTKTWNQFVSFAIELDRRLGRHRSGWRYLTRYLVGDESRGPMLWAGQLARGQLTKPAERYVEPGPQLDALRFALEQDAAWTKSASTTPSLPIVLMLAAEAPLSGAAVRALYADLTRKARVIWIVTPEAERLLSTFKSGAVTVVLQHDAVDRVESAIYEARLPQLPGFRSQW